MFAQKQTVNAELSSDLRDLLPTDDLFEKEAMEDVSLERLFNGQARQASQALFATAAPNGTTADMVSGQQAPTSHDETRNAAPQGIQALAVRAAAQSNKVTWLARERPAQSPFNMLQQWEGYVEERTPDSFVAKLVSVFGEPSPGEEIAEILLAEVNRDDLELVKPGAVFYWTVGFEESRRGYERVSGIRFRRLPALTKNDLIRVIAEADESSKRLGWD